MIPNTFKKQKFLCGIYAVKDSEYEHLISNGKFDDIYAEKLTKKYQEQDFDVIWPKNKQNKNTRWISSFNAYKNNIKNNVLGISKNGGIQIRNYPSEKEIREWKTFGKLKNNFYLKEFSQGTNELKSIGVKFDNPKSTSLLKFLLNLIPNSRDSLILDFFAGSGTTGHATMLLNKEDNGNRKFILCTNNENNIATKITYERLFRIIKGKTTKGKKNFKWLDKNKSYKDAKLRVINIDDTQKISTGLKVSDKIITDCKNGLVLLNPHYNTKKELNLYYDLAALNPLKNNEDKF